MVCPYCNNHPIPNAPVCNHCGVILKIARASRKPAKPVPVKRIFLRATGYLVAAVLLAALGYIAGRMFFEARPGLPIVLAAAGAALGLVLMYAVSTGRVTIQAGRLNNRRRKLQSDIHSIEQARSKHLEASEKENKKKQASEAGAGENAASELTPDDRMELAAVQLIDGQVEESLQQLEQVYRLGHGGRVDFLNNVGVAFARRGQMQLSLDRFQQAIRLDPQPYEPHVNLVYSLMQTGDKNALGSTLASQNGSLKAAMEQPGIAGRVGLTYAITGKHEDAQHLVEQELRSADKNLQADAHNDLGIVKAMSGEHREALTEFGQALRLDPGHAPAIANTGVLYYRRQRHDEAAEFFENAVKVDPHNGQAHSQLGAAYCRMNFINEGIREFREARLHQMYLFEPNYNLGKVYVEQDILDEAERCLVRAYEINPFAWQIYVAQAALLFKQNNIDRSTQIYQQAHQAHPDEPMILGGLGLCTTLAGDYETAEAYFRRAISFKEGDADLLTNFAWHYLVRSEVQKASEVLEEVKNIDRKCAVANNNMALCQMEMGAYDAAEQYFKQALQTDPNLHTVHYNLGNDYISQKRLERAIEAWEKAKKVELGNADLHTNLGVAYYKQQQFEKSSMEFRRVLHLRQERAEDYANLGLALARMKRHKEAIQQFELGIQIEPQNPMLHSNLGLACYFANQVEDAMREWRIVTEVNRQYAQARAAKQQSEYDDSSVEFVPLYISERALYTPPKLPDFMVPFVPGYQTSRWELMITDPDVRRLESLKSQRDRVDRALRALKLA